MSDERSDRIKQIFDDARRLPPRERPAFVAAQCGSDPDAADLREKVQSLLDAYDEAGDFLQSPTVDPPPADSPPANAKRDATANGTKTGSAPITEAPGTRIGPYKLLQQIGEGGFGVVFMAEQQEPVRRRVALKVIKLGMDTRRVVARFEAERQALAMMDHPHIAKVLDAGATDSGRPYFVMELVRGEPVTAYCDRNRLSIRQRLELFGQVCNAVQHAHTKGVIHRDIKPSNVLVATQDGRPHARIIDFGIAKATDHRLTEKTLFTEHNAMIGTPAYMSPEQAEGTLDIDTRTDVYSLGVLLYELLTGVAPFDETQLRAAAMAEMLRIIRDTEPPKPSTRLSESSRIHLPETPDRAKPTLADLARLRATEPKKLGLLVRGELDWIVMKALDKDRARRYETASAFADDVQRHLTGEPVIAAPPSVGYRLRKFARRYKGQVIAASLVLVTLLLGIAGTTVGFIRANKANMILEEVNQEAHRAFEKVILSTWAGDSSLGAGSVHGAVQDIDGKLEFAIEHGRDGPHLAITSPSDSKHVREKIMFRVMADEAVESFEENTKLAYSLEQQRDGAKLDAYSANIGAAQLAMAFGAWPEARAKLDACDSDLRGWEWQFLRRKAESILLEFRGTSYAEFSPDGSVMAIGFEDGTVHLIDRHTGAVVGSLGPCKTELTHIEYSPDGHTILTTHWDYTVRLWDGTTGRQLGESIPMTDLIARASFSPDGKHILTAIGSSTDLQLWDGASKKQIGGPIRNDVPVEMPAFVPDGSLLLTVLVDVLPPEVSSDSSVCQFWSAATGELISEPIRVSARLVSVALSADGKRILTGTKDGSVQQWDARSGATIGCTLQHDGGRFNSAIYSPDGNLILTSSFRWNSFHKPSHDSYVQLWDATSCEPIGEPIRHEDHDDQPVFAPNGRLILTTGWGPDARLWDSARAHCVGSWECPSSPDEDDTNSGRSFSPDSQLVMLGSLGYVSGTTYVVPTSQFSTPERRITGEDLNLKIAALAGDDRFLNPAMKQDAAIAPDGKREVRIYPDRSIRFFAIADGGSMDLPGKVVTLATNEGEQDVMLHPNGSAVILEQGDNGFEIAVDRETGQSGNSREVAAVRLDEQPIGLLFSVDGTRLIIRLEGDAALVWDTRGPADQQTDRSERDADRTPALSYVKALLDGPTSFEGIQLHIRGDASLSPLQRLVRMQSLREIQSEMENDVDKIFEPITKENVTVMRVRAACSAMQIDTCIPYPERVKAALMRKAESWNPDAGDLINNAWRFLESPDVPIERIEAALEATREAARMLPDNCRVYRNLGAAYYRMGQFQEALGQLEMAIAPKRALADIRTDTHSLIAMCHVRLNQIEDARAALREASEMEFRIDGRVDGSKLSARMEAPMAGRGDVEYVISSDGRSFSGRYKYDFEQSWNEWNGTRKTGSSMKRFDGLWDTTKDGMWFTTEGSWVSGIYGIKGVYYEAVSLFENSNRTVEPDNQPAEAP